MNRTTATVALTALAIAVWTIFASVYFNLSLIAVLVVDASLLLLGIAPLILVPLTTVQFGDVQGFRERITRDAEAGDRGFALLKEYHAQGLAQSKISFWFSLVFSALGFGIILLAIVKVFSPSSPDWFDAVVKPTVTLVSGTVVDAVGALFFVQSNRVRQLMTEFFDKLRTDRKLDEALRLAETINNPMISSNLKAVLALQFVDAKLELPMLTTILQGPLFAAAAEKQVVGKSPPVETNNDVFTSSTEARCARAMADIDVPAHAAEPAASHRAPRP